MAALDPPYGIRQAGARVLIVPASCPPSTSARPQAIAEALPFNPQTSALAVGTEIAIAINAYPNLVRGLSDLIRELAQNPRNLTRRQQVAMIDAAVFLKSLGVK